MNSYMKNKFVKSIPSEVSIKQTDRNLWELIRERLPQAPEDVWFSQKVMNRLPEKRKRQHMPLAEKFCYIASLVFLITGWGATLINALRFGLTPLTLTLAAILPAITLFCVFTVAAPALRRTFGGLWP